jgi:hypothetical protein
MGGWMEGKAGLRIANSNQKYTPKQFALNRWLVDRKDQSNRYNFEDLVDIYYHTSMYASGKIDVNRSLKNIN